MSNLSRVCKTTIEINLTDLFQDSSQFEQVMSFDGY